MEKVINIDFEDKNYECKIISEDNQNINVNLKNTGSVKFRGNISLKEIYEKIPAFEDYSMEEIFAVIKELNNEKFKIIKESDKYKFDMAIKVLKKEKHLILELNEVIQSEDDIIKDLLSTYQNQNKRIKELEEKLKNLKELIKNEEEKIEKEEKEEKRKEEKVMEDNFDLNYEFKLEDFTIEDLKEEKTIFNYESLNHVYNLKVLKDGRIAAGNFLDSFFQVITRPSGISIFDKDTYEEKIFIKYSGGHFIELRNGNLLTNESGQGKSNDKLHIIKLNENSFDILQTINFDTKIYKTMLELSNGVLSLVDKNNKKIIFYKKENDKYCHDYDIQLKDECNLNLEGNKNELIYSEGKEENCAIIFYDYETKKEIAKINNMSMDNYLNPYNVRDKISNNLIAISYNDELLLIDYKKRNFLRKFKANGISYFHCICPINKSSFLLSYEIIGKLYKTEQIIIVNNAFRPYKKTSFIDKCSNSMVISTKGELLYEATNKILMRCKK